MSNTPFGFQKLDIYQIAKEIVKQTYSYTKEFPQDEKYALVQQMSRAAVSVPSNIAEGTSRSSSKEKTHFINIAYGSLMELVCQMEIAKELNYLSENQYENIVDRCRTLSVKMSNYKKAIEKPVTSNG